MITRGFIRNLIIIAVGLLSVTFAAVGAWSADVLSNGSFDAGISTGWTDQSSGQGTAAWDEVDYGIASGSLRGRTATGQNQGFILDFAQTVGPINSTDIVHLSFWWYKWSQTVPAGRHTMILRIIKPAGDSTDIWTETTIPAANSSLTGNYNSDVSAFFDQTGNYTIRLIGDLQSGTDGNAYAQGNFDDVVLNVQGGVNNAPMVTAGATQVSVSPTNRLGANTTVISTDFGDSDQPGVSAFTVTFKIREPNNTTELTLVNNQPNGGGGLTITDNGGGSYTASYTYNPDDAQTTGLYDLYFEVTDGTDSAIDNYIDNADELEINEVVANNAPTVTPGATHVSVSPVNRFGLNTTVVLADFSDTDQPGINAFKVTLKIREPNNTTELTLVNNLPHGSGGLSIIDNGGGSYTASYTYNPDDAQTTGLYDLYFEVTDGIDSVVDGYADNPDELEINEVFTNNPPQVGAGATRTSKSQTNRKGTDSTVLSATFTDLDNPGIGAFAVTFKVREPDNSTEIVLVNNQPDGAAGVTIVDNGGSYTAKYTYNPDDAQTLGFYDLYFEVTDGTDNAIDGYADNLDELEIIDIPTNNPPVLAASATTVFPSSVDRFGAATTELSAVFTDGDSPGIGAFAVTFRLRTPYNGGLVIVVDALGNGQGGLTITDNGGGSYTARINWDPPDDQVLGYYDLSCLVSDGTDTADDGFDNNPNELLLTNGGENAPPVVSADNTFASPAAIERIGAHPTIISATFQDVDLPGVGAFTVTFKLRQPDNSAEIILADNLGDGVGGVSISDGGGGIYTASISWDPPDAQTLGVYDLYFQVTDGVDTSYDAYADNLDELEVYDAISNNAPTVVAGATAVLPSSITRLGSEYTMIQTLFSDVDVPGRGAFTITIKVRDQSAVEYTIVNAAGHKQQGLRVEHVSGSDYEASVLWDPPVGQVTGTYDLYFYVEDNKAAAATDGYANNADELTITATAIAGDGNLLRRTNDVTNCGGTNSACHNIADHQTQNCLVCHAPHQTTNIYLVRDTIQTPNSGLREVIFKTLGIGDPYNDPDPTVGDPSSGVMADFSNGVYTGVCEVCHTSTSHHRNDGSEPLPDHNDATVCTNCHPHEGGFAAGESGGGMSCTCHQTIFVGMDSTSTKYRHILANDDADYSPGASGMAHIKNCLTCHVDHDIFRPDLNTGVGQRGKNLRVDYVTDPVQGDNAVLSNTDYSSAGLGGLCLSCHSGPGCTGCHSSHASASVASLQEASQSTYDHVFIPKDDYDAVTSTHNYSVASTFGEDGSTFNANCVKCHNDNTTKSYQSSTYMFSVHGSDFNNLLNPLGAVAPTDPLEEKLCFRCHSTTSNPNAGSNLDYYGVKSMTNPEALDLEAVFGRTYTHPTAVYSGRHRLGEDAAALADGNRHAECGDCHNPHAAQQGTHDGSSNLISNALKGTWGVEPTSWPAAPTPTDNGNLFAAPSGYDQVNPAQKEYQICLKCHSNYTTLPSGKRNLAEEINPNYTSTHGIVQAGTNAYCNTNTMNEPWGSSGIAWCSDCHRSSNTADPEGPHGSNQEHLLVATVVSNSSVGTPLCYVCHKESEYWSGNTYYSRYPDHPADRSAHRRSQGCFACHMWEYSSTSGLGVSTTNWSGGTPPAGILVHGMNKKWVYNEQNGSSGTGQNVDAFTSGYLENMDYTNRRCWSATCRGHSNQGY